MVSVSLVVSVVSFLASSGRNNSNSNSKSNSQSLSPSPSTNNIIIMSDNSLLGKRKAETTVLSATTSTDSKNNKMQASLTMDLLTELASQQDMVTRTNTMESNAKNATPLTESELDDILSSLQYLTPSEKALEGDIEQELLKVLQQVCHISHKDWKVTMENAQKLKPFLIPDDATKFPGGVSQVRFARILQDGNWKGACDHATNKNNEQSPWAVLVTGVNGIRKTTSLYQPWFGELLQEALIVPKDAPNDADSQDMDLLPTGANSFFRQLDHMIATLCNRDFALLYAHAAKRLQEEQSNSNNNHTNESTGDPSPETIRAYSNLKAAIFTRYRTLSELLGVLLLQQAHTQNLNCLMETSGRDVAMFHYIDTVFPSQYRKLALHFRINDLSHAQTSVDRRMIHEIQTGIQAIDASTTSSSIDVAQVIAANAGGPYGSEVLPGVQQASSAVWKTVVDGSAGVGEDWYKATIQINAHPTDPWTAQAVKPDGSLGTVFPFERK